MPKTQPPSAPETRSPFVAGGLTDAPQGRPSHLLDVGGCKLVPTPESVADSGRDAVAFVLVRHPRMQLLLRHEGPCFLEPGLALPIGGGARMAFMACTDKPSKMLQTSSSKAASSSPTPLMPCFLMKAGSQQRSESCNTRMATACCTWRRLAESSCWRRAHALFRSWRSRALTAFSDSSNADLPSSSAAVLCSCGCRGMQRRREGERPLSADCAKATSSLNLHGCKLRYRNTR